MCLRIKVQTPDHVLAEGGHAGYEWVVTHNGMGFRCGYVRVPLGHPWHGKDIDALYMDMTFRNGPGVHGGITFAEPDMPCDKGGEDNAWWFGFDCGHSSDAQDPALPCDSDMMEMFRRGVIRTQKYVESECRKLCEQAAAAAAK